MSIEHILIIGINAALAELQLCVLLCCVEGVCSIYIYVPNMELFLANIILHYKFKQEFAILYLRHQVK